MTDSEAVFCASCGGVVVRPKRSPKLPLSTKRWCSKPECDRHHKREVARARREGTLS